MIKMVIVDDDEKDSSLLRSYILQYVQERGIEVDMSVYNDGTEFVALVETGNVVVDAVFLDICMPNINGMDIATKLRAQNNSCNIVFCTNMAQYAIEGYSVRALDFLLKPVDYTMVSRALDNIFCLIDYKMVNSNEPTTIEINDNISKISMFVPVSDITHIEIKIHKLFIYTETQVYEEWRSLKDIEQYLPKQYFIRCHSAFLVNLKHVRGIKGKELYVGKHVLTLTRFYRKEFLAAFARYMKS